jgi:putative membrane protein
MHLYDPRDWHSHLFDIRGSMLREIAGRVLAIGGWAAVVVAARPLAARHEIALSIPETAHSLIGVALGLLLVLRTNSSYDRFWEGRKLWGTIVNDSRNLARMGSVYFVAAPELARRLLLWMIAFAHSTMHRLRGTAGLGPVAAELPPDEVRQALAEGRLPLAVSRRITQAIAEGRRRGLISDIQLAAFDGRVQSLVDSLGGCERIHNTPMPFAYAVHLRRALILYCLALPFALAERYGWMTPPAVLLIAFVLFGVEEIGVEIEDPFGDHENDLPLEQICATIETDLREVMAALPGEPGPEAAGR